jgi:hypothetical protein
MQYRINRKELLAELAAWNSFLGRRIYLIACGGTALTLLGIKDSTKDIDLMLPKDKDYIYLVNLLGELGYKQVTGVGWVGKSGFQFDLFVGNKIHTTELLESPLETGNHIPLKEFSRIYLGVLNYYDLIISKLFRGTPVDIDDCLALIRAKRDEISMAKFESRFRETANYEVSKEKVLSNLKHFLERLGKGEV